ncbi:hypothetical protein JL100_032860 (plasmid) [Skermanella mucosa]|uniref:hypothetical protein n=1 Tax=Skermanella mucosa TaxID=1789672 RepID=UPI00192CAE5D|nr:hypothetical protein [Skermanella mucosa]UEM24413.1 hypothetical protein JL100_032860 [Skermanella mucosa]
MLATATPSQSDLRVEPEVAASALLADWTASADFKNNRSSMGYSGLSRVAAVTETDLFVLILARIDVLLLRNIEKHWLIDVEGEHLLF